MYYLRIFSTWGMLLLFLLMIFFHFGDGVKIPTTLAPTTPKVDPKNQPGKVTQTFTGNESSWVPGVSAAVIVIIVFLISIFACCIHCPFCIVYKRNSNHRIV